MDLGETWKIIDNEKWGLLLIVQGIKSRFVPTKSFTIGGIQWAKAASQSRSIQQFDDSTWGGSVTRAALSQDSLDQRVGFH